ADYGYVQSTGATIVTGTVDIGNHTDDGMTLINLPFTYMLYGQAFTTASASSNGTLQFASSNSAYSNTCLPTSNFSYALLPYWDDLYTGDTANGHGIFTSTSGTAPNRIFNVEWRANPCCSGGAPTLNFEIRLYESQDRFDFVYGSTIGNGGTSATVGAQRDTGVSFTQFECN